MRLKEFAEAVILQSIEDLWDRKYRAESIDFFTGREFRVLAEMAGMDTERKIELLRLVKHISKITRKECARRDPGYEERPRVSAALPPHETPCRAHTGR